MEAAISSPKVESFRIWDQRKFCQALPAVMLEPPFPSARHMEAMKLLAEVVVKVIFSGWEPPAPWTKLVAPRGVV